MIDTKQLGTKNPNTFWSLRPSSYLGDQQLTCLALSLPLLSIQEGSFWDPQKIVSPISIGDFVHHSELFKCVKKSEEAIQRLTNAKQRPDAEQKMNAVVERLNTTGDLLESDLMKDPNIEDFVVLAFQEGKISQIQLGTFFFWNSFLNQTSPPEPSSYEKVRLENMPPERGENLKKQFVYAALSGYCQLFGSSDEERTLDAEYLFEEWYKKACELPPSERSFFVLKDQDVVCGRAPSVVKRLLQINIPLYKKITTVFMGDPDASEIVYPSMGMMNAFLGISGRCVEIVVRFAARQDNIGPGRRDVTVRNPYQLTPKNADTYPAPGAEYTTHDLCYHVPIVNRIPIEEQTLLTNLAEQLLKKGSRLDDMRVFLLTDMEFHRDGSKPSHENCISYLRLLSDKANFSNLRSLFEKLPKTSLVQDVMREIFLTEEEMSLLQEIDRFFDPDQTAPAEETVSLLFKDTVELSERGRKETRSYNIWNQFLRRKLYESEDTGLKFNEFLKNQPASMMQEEILKYSSALTSILLKK